MGNRDNYLNASKKIKTLLTHIYNTPSTKTVAWLFITSTKPP